MLPAATPGQAVRVLALVALAGTVACAGRVKQETYDTEMGQVRSEMQERQQELEQLSSRMQQLSGRVDSLDRRTAALRQELQREMQQFREEFNTRIEETEQALTFNVPVYFEFDEATVRPQDHPVLDRFAKVVDRYYRNALITVEGFADPSGPAEYNMWLGRQRAEAVRDYLAQTGLDTARVRTVSYGEVRQRQVQAGAAGPGMPGMVNRRVALVIDHGGEPMRGSETAERPRATRIR